VQHISSFSRLKLGENINITNRSTKALLEGSRQAGLEVNAEKTKCILMSRHQNAGENYNLLMANKFFENVSMVKYFGTTVVNQNFIYGEIKGRVNSGNICYFLFRVFCLVISSLKHNNDKNIQHCNTTRCFVWV
jgi:hypothetical protein